MTWIFAGLALALSASPYNLWPLAMVGLAVLYRSGEQRSRRRQSSSWFGAFVILFLVGLSWTRQYNIAGYVLLSAVQALLFVVASQFLPRQRGWPRAIAFPAVLTLAELGRTYFPWGGLPMGGLTTGQANGPFASAVAIVGETGLMMVLGCAAVAASEIFRLRHATRRIGLLALIPVALSLTGSAIEPRVTGSWNVAAVQGGGVQALKRGEQDPAEVFRKHVAASRAIQDPVDLIVWPENVIVTNEAITKSSYSNSVAAVATDHAAAVIAGVVETEGNRFRNAAVGWDSQSGTVARYEKVQRVPFGEFVPHRRFFDAIADLSQVPSDAIEGTGPPVLQIAGHRVGVAISYEGLFSRRLRSAVRNGGELLVIPTNASSYKSPNVAAAQVQGARLRARETARWVIQSSPTGRSAIVSPDGKVRAQSAIGPAAVLQETVDLSQGFTPYVRWGDTPILGLCVVTLGLSWLRRRRKPDPKSIREQMGLESRKWTVP